MRPMSCLITVLLILGPIGMGMLFNVDAPMLEENPSIVETDKPISKNHGTRSEPEEGSTVVGLQFHSVDEGTMNATDMNFLLKDEGSGTFDFTLQHPLNKDLLVEDTTNEKGMRAYVWVEGPGTSLEVNVYDNEGSTLIGSGILSPIDFSGVRERTIDIEFGSAYGDNYIFAAGHVIVIEFIFATTGRLYYDSFEFESSLLLNCKPIGDISIDTYNFHNDPTPQTLFYPNDIAFPTERKQIIIKGRVTDAFTILTPMNSVKYIQHVDVQIQGPGTNDTERAEYSHQTRRFSYTWQYDSFIMYGKYNVTAHVVDRQGNEFTVLNYFNMSEFGVLMTEPHQKGGEGSFKANAERYVSQGEKTTYYINVRNIGWFDTGVSLETTGPDPDWDWWFEGENITTQNEKTAVITSIDAGKKKGVRLVVNSLDNPLHRKATILVTASCIADPLEDHTLTTKTTVTLRYDVDLKFKDGTKSKSETVEMGEEVVYEFKVTNEGGGNDTIWINVETPPSGWSKTLSGDRLKGPVSQPYVALDSYDYAELTLTLYSPTSGDDATEEIDITGQSQGAIDNDMVVTDTIVTITTITKGIELELTNERIQEAEIDERVEYQFELTNTGAFSANYTVSYTSPSGGWNSGDIWLSETDFSNLNAGNSATFSLYAKPTNDVMANDYSITVTASKKEDSSKFDDQEVNCIVQEYYNLEVTEPSDFEFTSTAEPGDDINFTIIIRNNGNTRESVSINVGNTPKGWTVDFGEASSEWNKDIEPKETKTASLMLTVPEDAEGDETVDITISVVPFGRSEDAIQIEAHITIEEQPFQVLVTLLVPILLFIVIIVMVVIIYKRR